MIKSRFNRILILISGTIRFDNMEILDSKDDCQARCREAGLGNYGRCLGAPVIDVDVSDGFMKQDQSSEFD